jgi:hypothetical protein
MRSALLAVLVATLAAAASAVAAIPHEADVAKLYARDHGGHAPASAGALAPYSREYERLLAVCSIRPADLSGAATSMARQVAAAAGKPFSSLMMLQALTRHITWTTRRDCWDAFFDVESAQEVKAATARLQYRHEVEALYVIDHHGKRPASPVQLLPYSTAFTKIMGACMISAEDNTNLMIQLSDKATVLGARNVTSLGMLQAVARRIDWHGKRPCWSVYDDAEGHMETGGP